MKKADLLSTFFVGIDISSRINIIAFLDFESQKPLQNFAVDNNQPGAVELVNRIATYLRSKQDLAKLVVVLESTSFYGIHVANYLSSCEVLASFHTSVYCLNSKTIRNYKKSFIDLVKNNYVNAFVIADFARANRINAKPSRGNQFLALQRLPQHRLHLVKSLTREKAYMLSNIFLKFSDFSLLEAEEQPFFNSFGATASSALTDFLSTEELIKMSTEDLIRYICEKGHNRSPNPEKILSASATGPQFL